VCLLQAAFNELKNAECTTLTPQDIEKLVSDKSRRDPNPQATVPDEEVSKAPYYAEGCITPKYFVDGRPNDMPPEDGLRLFGMYPRSSEGVNDNEDKTHLNLPLYYHILANALLGHTEFELLTTPKVVDVLSKMTPSQYLFAGKNLVRPQLQSVRSQLDRWTLVCTPLVSGRLQ